MDESNSQPVYGDKAHAERFLETMRKVVTTPKADFERAEAERKAQAKPQDAKHD